MAAEQDKKEQQAGKQKRVHFDSMACSLQKIETAAMKSFKSGEATRKQVTEKTGHLHG